MNPLYPALDTVLWGYPVSWFLAMAGTLLYAWKGRWLKPFLSAK